MPVNLEYDLSELEQFFDHLDDPPVLAFYGGEPLVNSSKMIEIMDHFPSSMFMLQTNGTLLHRIPPSYLNRFHSILVSVDGRPEVNDMHRGPGVFKRVMRAAELIRERGFSGDLVARMTITPESDILEDVKFLLTADPPDFDHVHWQLDVMWGTEFYLHRSEIKPWLLERYNRGIAKLVKYWIDEIERSGEIPGIVPFLGIMHSLVTKDPVTSIRCGAGTDFFSVTTDGRVTVCPILPLVSFSVEGNIITNKPGDLVNSIPLEDPCPSCEVLEICGGRCLYANKTKYWGEEGFELVCQTVKHLITELRAVLPWVRALLGDGRIMESDLIYPKVPNGVEIIP